VQYKGFSEKLDKFLERRRTGKRKKHKEPSTAVLNSQATALQIPALYSLRRQIAAGLEQALKAVVPALVLG
jgi:hypothetical protein